MENSTSKNKEEKREREKPGIRQWMYGILASICVVLFVIWTGYWPVLILIPVFIDIYITKFIRWGAWKESKNSNVRKVLDWVDAILFALVGVYFITTFFFQNYQIPTSSLEKSLLVGDFLCVNKMVYGARSPMTPLSFPLVQHTFPITESKTYFEKPQLEYKRFAGLRSVERYDIVVFNYPSGDTVATKRQSEDYYMLCAQNGWEMVNRNKAQFGDVIYRPVDRRENYVKRCVGMPGDMLEMRNDTTYINGKALLDPEHMQLLYCIQTDGTEISQKIFDDLGMSDDDYQGIYAQNAPKDSLSIAQFDLKKKGGKTGLLLRNVNLTKEMIKELEAKPFVWKIMKQNEFNKRWNAYDRNHNNTQPVYPINYYPASIAGGDYPATWIPKKGETIKFDTNVDYKVAVYERCIKNYEHNDFEYRDGKVYINGKEVDSYTFKFDYYFMMGDNRDKSADSRMWGFVPEDHVVGQPMFIWLSLNKDKSLFGGKIRWERIFTKGNKNK